MLATFYPNPRYLLAAATARLHWSEKWPILDFKGQNGRVDLNYATLEPVEKVSTDSCCSKNLLLCVIGKLAANIGDYCRQRPA